jgi:hypothetical protein
MRAARWLVILGGLAAIAAGAFYIRASEPAQHLLSYFSGRRARSLELDPLEPGRQPAQREGLLPGAPGGPVPVASTEAWVSARPAADLREERKPSARGGIDPCKAPDPGWGDYLPGQMRSGAYVTLPREAAREGAFDVVMHFHGHDLALFEFLRARSKFVFLGMTASRYSDRLSGPEALDELVKLAEREVEARTDRKAQARRVTIAAWSGGYAAISLLLEQSKRKPDAVVLFDGLHGSRDLSVLALQLEPIARFARRALKDEVFMYVSHSSIDTDGYASSTEGVHFLLSALGARPLRVEREDPLGMRLVELYSRGGFHSRGYAGGGKSDHCAHLALYPMVLRALERRWTKERR